MSVNRMLKTFFGKPQTRRLSRRISVDRSFELREIRIEPLEDRMLLAVTPTISVRPIVATPGTRLSNEMIQATATATVDGLAVTVPGTFSFKPSDSASYDVVRPQGFYYFTFNPVDTATYNAIQTQVPVTVLSPPALATTSPRIVGPTSAILTGVIDPGTSPADTYFQFTAGAQFTPTESSTIATGLLNPSAIAVDALGNVYVAETGNDAIRMIPADGSAITTIGSGFKAPVNVSTNGAGNIFVDDSGNGVIKQIFADGTIITLPPGTVFPTGGVTDPAGSLYELDKSNGSVRKLSVPSIPLGTLSDQNDPISVTHPLTGLTAGTTYSYRLVARNNEGFAVGETLSFVAGRQPDSLNDSYVMGGAGGNFLTDGIAPFASTPIIYRGRPALAIAGPSRSLSGFPAIGFIYDANGSERLDLTNANQQIEFPELNASAVSDMTSADFNGDGIPDIAVTGEYLTVIIANGNDYKTTPTTLSVSFSQTYSVAAGDLNGDGKPEIVVSGSGGGIDVFVNNGNGTFANAVHLAGPGISTSVSIADMNRDGKPDLITTAFETKSVSIYTGNGDATFNPRIAIGLDADAYGFAVADLNDDQLLDLVVTSNGTTSSITLLKNNGDGSFSARRTYPAGVNPIDVKVTDMNQDGKLDLVATNRGTVDAEGSVSLYFGIGDMTYAPDVSLGYQFNQSTGLVVPTSDVPLIAMQLVDFMQTGQPEIVMLSGVSGIATITYTGPQFFAEPIVSIGAGAGSAGNSLLETADVNSDGLLDVVAANNDRIVLYTNLGQGQFRQQVLRGGAVNPTGFLVTDLNQDGHQDIIYSNFNGSYLLLDDGNGTFIDGGSFSYAVDLQLLDINSDGLPDLVGHDRGGSPPIAFLNHGGGVFGRVYREVYQGRELVINFPDLFLTGPGGSNRSSGDLNNDGLDDIVWTGGGGIVVSLFAGQGTFTSVVLPFSDAAEAQFSFEFLRPVIADFNNDGVLDFAVRGRVYNNLFIYLNQGDGTFGSPVKYSFLSGIVSMDAGDFNGDGFKDIVVGRRNSVIWSGRTYFTQGTALSLLAGNGNGSFVKRHVGNTTGNTTLVAGRFDSSGVDGIFTPNGLMKMITPAITLNQVNLPQLAAAGTIVGDITATTTGVGAISYSFISGDGDTDNALFSLSSNGRLTAAVALDGRVKPGYSIRVQTVDSVGVIGEQVITVSLKAVGLTNVVSTLRDDASTAARTKVADIQVSAINSSVNVLSLSGPDASSFEIANGQLFLKAGVTLSVAKFSYNVTVNVDDPSLSGTPDASANYTLNITSFIPTNLSVSTPTFDMTPTVTWSPGVNAVRYEVYVQNLATNQVIRQTVTDTSWTPSADLGIARYQFWVRSINAANVKSTWSLPASFVVNTPVTIPVQTLGQTVRPQIVWTALPGAVSYEIWLTDASRKIAPFLQQTGLTSTSWTPASDLALGTYTFWVRGIDAVGRIAAWSSKLTFNVQAAPVPSSLMASTFSRQPSFSWTSPAGAASFVLTLANQTTGVTQTISGITGTSWTPTSNLADGRWTWRVRAVSQFGNMTYWSELAQIHVGGQVTVATPSATRTSPATFNWTAVSGAASYSLWLNRVDVPQAVVRRDGLTPTASPHQHHSPPEHIASGFEPSAPRAKSVHGAARWTSRSLRLTSPVKVQSTMPLNWKTGNWLPC